MKAMTNKHKVEMILIKKTSTTIIWVIDFHWTILTFLKLSLKLVDIIKTVKSPLGVAQVDIVSQEVHVTREVKLLEIFVKIIMSVWVDAVKVISVQNLFTVPNHVTLMLNAHFLDAAHSGIAVPPMYVMEEKQMEIFATKTQNASTINVISAQIIQNIQTPQSISIKIWIKAVGNL